MKYLVIVMIVMLVIIIDVLFVLIVHNNKIHYNQYIY